MAYDYDTSVLSDLHKAARGFRPGKLFWETLETVTENEKQKIWDRLIQEVEDSIELERNQKQRALADYEKALDELIKVGAPNKETAMRWYLESLEMDLQQGGEYVCCFLGLDYSMAGEFDVVIHKPHNA